MNLPASKFVKYTADEHGFYEELVRLVICLGSVGKAIELHAIGTVKKFKTSDTIVIEGKHNVSGLEVHFFPRPFYDRLLSASGKQVEFVRVIKQPINPSSPRHPIFLPNVQAMMARLVGDAFVSYYERHLDAAEANWEKESKGKWPAVWRFGWAIRNACSHNGKIFIRDPRHPGVQWRNLRYDFNDNGRSILFDDLTGVELILLMEEMDTELRRPPSVEPEPPSPLVK
jgi:hypothetical protein